MEEKKDDLNTFITGVDIDEDEWRKQTVEELQGWLEDLKTRKTAMGDPLVEFPEGWDSEFSMTEPEQLDLLATRLSESLTGPEGKEAQLELKNIQQQSKKLRKLEQALAAMGSDSDEEETPEDPNPLEETIIPKIDTSGPNPFEITGNDLDRLQEIDRLLGAEEQPTEPSRSLDEVNQELLELYKNS